MSNRDFWQSVAEETMDIINKGFYENEDGTEINILNSIDDTIKNTKLYRPTDTEELLNHFSSNNSFNTIFEVRNETTLEGAQRLLYEGFENVLALNFASAKYPGGGFLRGSRAQEESLARSSTLYASISREKEMYNHNKKLGTGLYSDYMIYSPNVIVFRNDDGDLLSKPYEVSFITSPAVNAGIVQGREKENKSKISFVMQSRIEKILSVALENGHENIVLGAFGCGVFKNNPQQVAGYFRKALRENPKFKNRFKKVVFSILDNSSRQEVIQPFHYAFS